MQTLVRTRFVALDSSHLGDWSRDKASTKRSRKNAAAAFEQELLKNGAIVLLCWHHLEELLCTRNPAVAAARIHFLQSLPIVSWIAPASRDDGLGAIVDVLAAEAKAALSLKDASALEVRDCVSKTLVRVGTGAEAVGPYVDIWRELQPELWASEQKRRQAVAITRSSAIGTSDVRVTSLLEGQIPDAEDIERRLDALHAALTQEIATRGDKRISNPSDVAKQFVGAVNDAATPRPKSTRELVLRVLSLVGLDLDSLEPETKVSDILELVISRGRLLAAAETGGLSWPELEARLRWNQLPSFLIDRALRMHGQDLRERKGSDMTDRYLACLAPYADFTYVDRRTKENFRRARQKSPEVVALIRNVERASNYNEIANHLSA